MNYYWHCMPLTYKKLNRLKFKLIFMYMGGNILVNSQKKTYLHYIHRGLYKICWTYKQSVLVNMILEWNSLNHRGGTVYYINYACILGNRHCALCYTHYQSLNFDFIKFNHLIDPPLSRSI